MRSRQRLLAWIRPLTALVAVVAAAWLFWPSQTEPPAAGIDPAAFAAALDRTADGFADGQGDWSFDFPRDLGPHPDHRTEVWDLSGLLIDDGGRRYGLRLTFVRIGLVPPSRPRASTLAANAVMLARFVLVPETDEGVVTAQRLSRAAGGLAGAVGDPVRVWLEDWSLVWGEGGALRLAAGVDGVRLTLRLMPEKVAVTETQMGPLAAAGAGSSAGGAQGPGFHFYLQPRMSVEGRLSLAGAVDETPDRGRLTDQSSAASASFVPAADAIAEADSVHDPVLASASISGSVPVRGTAWLERAWGSMPGGLAGQRGQLSLNRFSLQLDDHTELMCVHLRRRGGGGTPIPTCVAIGDDGETRLFERRQLTLEPSGERWTSPEDGTRYPLWWRLAVPALGLDVALAPLSSQQELGPGLASSGRLWSGAVTLSGRRDGEPVTGGGRMDLGGYAADSGT